MKAIVLAAGKGTRLAPLTEMTPKPMLPLSGKPIMEHTIELLMRHGIRDIYMNLHHRAKVIKNHFGNGHAFGVDITYLHEPELLGTAGAVKNFEKYIGQSQFMVVYGDNYTDCNLTEVMTFHTEKKGLGTIVVFLQEDVLSSGIVQLNDENRILRFVEKPRPESVFSNLVNSGIYVFEPDVFGFIPAGRFSDFGKDIFPRLLKARCRLYGFIMDGILEGIDTVELYQHLSAKILNANEVLCEDLTI